MMRNEITLDITLKSRDLSKFLIRHTYFRFGGIFSILISVVSVIALFAAWDRLILMQRVVLVLLGLLFTVIQPLMLWNKGRKQCKQELFQKPFHYIFSEQGITISQGEYKEEHDWNTIRKAVFTKNTLIIYMTAVSAYIIPEARCVPGVYAELKQLVKEKVK